MVLKPDLRITKLVMDSIAKWFDPSVPNTVEVEELNTTKAFGELDNYDGLMDVITRTHD